MTASTAPASFFDLYSRHINATKGLLVLLVVMDHNDLIRALAPDLFRPLTFHVVGFLILPFLMPIKAVSLPVLRDRMIRYLVPFWWILTFAALMYAVLFRSDGLVGATTDWVAAAMIGSAPLVKLSSGFYYLWFLPALLGLVALLMIYHSVARTGKTLILATAVTFHLGITLLPPDVFKYLPFGLPIVLWVFPVGLLIRWAMSSASVYQLRYLVGALFVGSYGYLVILGRNVEVMTLELNSISSPLLFLLQDTSAITGMLVSVWCASALGKLRFVNASGKHSLMLYLLHPLVFFLGYKLSGAANWQMEPAALLAASALSFGATAAASLVLAWTISRVGVLNQWITPRDWASWGPVHLVRNNK